MQKLAIVVASLLLASTAYAQNSNSAQQQSSPPSGQQAANPQTPRIAAQIRQNLESSGFKNIRLMPSSFLVRAEDKDGNPVMMVINPDSVTAIKEVETNKTTGQSQGNNSNSGQSGSGASAQPNAR
jgi:hypothetical protein